LLRPIHLASSILGSIQNLLSFGANNMDIYSFIFPGEKEKPEITLPEYGRTHYLNLKTFSKLRNKINFTKWN